MSTYFMVDSLRRARGWSRASLHHVRRRCPAQIDRVRAGTSRTDAVRKRSAASPMIVAMPETSSSGPSITREEIAHLANLARIGLTDAELDHLGPQLSVILESVASISGVADENTPPTSHALPLTN